MTRLELNVSRSEAGFTIVEMLTVLVVMGLLLGGLAAFFATQTNASSRLQSRNRLDTNIRAVAEIVMQDLQQAGSLATYDGGGAPQYYDSDPALFLPADCTGEEKAGCVVVGGGGALVTTYYATSLVRPAGGSWAVGGAAACRRIDYLVQDETFFRRDVQCADTASGFESFAFAEGITSVTVQFTCHQPNVQVASPTDCYDTDTYPREAVVTVVGFLEERDRYDRTLTLGTTVPNLRPPVDYLELVGE